MLLVPHIARHIKTTVFLSVSLIASFGFLWFFLAVRTERGSMMPGSDFPSPPQNGFAVGNPQSFQVEPEQSAVDNSNVVQAEVTFAKFVPVEQRDPSIRAQLVGAVQSVDNIGPEEDKMSHFRGTILGSELENGTLPLVNGEYYFVGIGNWNQGHGLGFSQYGAKGAALSGMNTDQIATYYYTGSSLATISEYTQILVDGYGTMYLETYVSGLGEIPDKACGTQEQVNANPSKYVLPNPNLWENGCWPEDAIKAQVIVARSYAYTYGGSICTTSACQVYKGGEEKRWAQIETKGKILVSGGTPIHAYYSSDNNNGWGSGTHRKPMWCWDSAGNCGEGLSWLQSVYDNNFAAPGPYDDFIYRTNSYSLSDFDSMLSWYKQSGVDSTLRSYCTTVKSTIGSITSISFIRDNSCRVHKVRLIGTNGQIDFNGDKFTGVFNEWVWKTDPSGQHAANGNYDFISSLTYYLLQYTTGQGIEDPVFMNSSQCTAGSIVLTPGWLTNYESL